MRSLRLRPVDEIPTSSMADVAFLLVVFFMVTLTFAVTRGLDLGLPDDDARVTEVERVESILVEVLADGSVRADGRDLALDDLVTHLAPTLLAHPAKPVIVRTVPDAPYGRMVDVLDELRQARARLGLERDVAIAVPTQREMAAYW